MKPYWPVDMQYPITQKFGENVASYPKRHGHPGTDFGLPTLNNLYAVWDAKVKFAGYRPTSGYGREVDLLVNNRWLVIYGHLSEYEVQTGDTVKRGDVIGLSGGDPKDNDPIDGMSTGAHLHIEIRDLLEPQVYPLIGAVDPEIWLATDLDGAVTPEPASTTGMATVTDTVNIRLLPSKLAPDIGDLNRGQQIQLLGHSETDANGIEFVDFQAWVAKEYIHE